MPCDSLGVCATDQRRGDRLHQLPTPRSSHANHRLVLVGLADTVDTRPAWQNCACLAKGHVLKCGLRAPAILYLPTLFLHTHTLSLSLSLSRSLYLSISLCFSLSLFLSLFHSLFHSFPPLWPCMPTRLLSSSLSYVPPSLPLSTTV